MSRINDYAGKNWTSIRRLSCGVWTVCPGAPFWHGKGPLRRIWLQRGETYVADASGFCVSNSRTCKRRVCPALPSFKSGAANDWFGELRALNGCVTPDPSPPASTGLPALPDRPPPDRDDLGRHRRVPQVAFRLDRQSSFPAVVALLRQRLEQPPNVF